MKKYSSIDEISIPRILIKSLLLLIIFNFFWIAFEQFHYGNLTIYNNLISGRERLPFGENPAKSYNLSLFNLDAMIASHELSGENIGTNQIDIVFIGDSSVWGFMQKPEQTIAGLLNDYFSKEKKNVFVHNLGYPSISLLKDLMLIDRAILLEPELIIWLTTLEAFPTEKQLEIPIVKNNHVETNNLLEKYDLSCFDYLEDNILDKTLWNQRRNISDVINLQLYGFLWEATGIDQDYPEKYNQAQRDFPEPSEDYYGSNPGDDLNEILCLDVIKNGISRNENVDFIIINEPILISEGENSDIQYNYYYPRWAYDQYRRIMTAFTKENDFLYYDFWDFVPQEEFTNSAIHLSKRGEETLAKNISIIIDEYLEINYNEAKY